MQIDIIRIGNSKGVRIPKALLDECGFTDKANLKLRDHELVITPVKKPRQDWEKACREMSKNNEDLLLDRDILDHSFDLEEWEW